MSESFRILYMAYEAKTVDATIFLKIVLFSMHLE